VIITSESKKSDVRKTGASASSASKKHCRPMMGFSTNPIRSPSGTSQQFCLGNWSKIFETVSVGSGLGEIGIHNKKTQKSQDKIHH